MQPETIATPLCSTGLEQHLSERICWAAIQAPSAENRHAFHPVWTDPVNLELRATAAHFELTPQLRFLADIAAGAMVENVRCMAAEAGFSLSQTWSSGTVRARLHLGPHGSPDGLAEAIAERCTNRRPYATVPLEDDLRQRLCAAGCGIPGVETTILDAPAKDLFAHAAAWAEGARLRSRVLHDEMYDGIRFAAGWTTSVPEGIPPGSLEVESYARPGFTALRSWSLCRMLGPLGAAYGFGWRSGRFLVDRSAAVIVFDSALAPEQSAPVIGQAMQRVWLQATRLGLAVQPMPAAALFALPWWQGVPGTTRSRLLELWMRILPGRTPLMALRVGRASAPSLRAGRTDLDAIPVRSRHRSAGR